MSSFHEPTDIHALPQGSCASAPSTGTEASSGFIWSPLELYDSNSSYAAAKFRLPSDARLGEGNCILNILIHKIVAPFFPPECIQNINITYYHLDEVQPGKLLHLTAHLEKEGVVRADISSSYGSRVACAQVFRAYDFKGKTPVRRTSEKKSLRSPIILDAQPNRRVMRATSLIPTERHARGKDPVNGFDYLNLNI
ncbi:hypothetical protein BJX66DRAFT_317501 [Aspergillus keveii]|uniref:Thioesterase family protein n=1 Tax=Aspergillus keveii TaxID=714993 RepID=A0ABR4FL69_9EURO